MELFEVPLLPARILGRMINLWRDTEIVIVNTSSAVGWYQFEPGKSQTTMPYCTLCTHAITTIVELVLSWRQVCESIVHWVGLCSSAHADLGLDEDDDEPVPLPNVNGAIMRKVSMVGVTHQYMCVCPVLMRCVVVASYTSFRKMRAENPKEWHWVDIIQLDVGLKQFDRVCLSSSLSLCLG